MLYAGAVAAGAFAGHQVTLFGEPRSSRRSGRTSRWRLAGRSATCSARSSAGAIGYYGGRPFLERHGRWVHVTPDRLGRAEAWFERYGDWAVFFSRVMPVVRSFISIPAGVARDAARPLHGAHVRLGAALVLRARGRGVALGSSWERFHESFRYADYAIVGLLVARGRLRRSSGSAEPRAAQGNRELAPKGRVAPWRSRLYAT